MRDSFESRAFQWRRERWPKPCDSETSVVWDIVKLGEEAGEVARSYTRYIEGRASLVHIAEELGDVLVCVSVIAGAYGWNIEDLRAEKWERVIKEQRWTGPTLAQAWYKQDEEDREKTRIEKKQRRSIAARLRHDAIRKELGYLVEAADLIDPMEETP